MAEEYGHPGQSRQRTNEKDPLARIPHDVAGRRI